MSRRDLVKEQYWRDAVAGWQSSGLTKTQYCRRQNLRLNVFCGWQKIIRQRDAETKHLAVPQLASKQLKTPLANEREGSNTEPIKFLEVKVARGESKAASSESINTGNTEQIEVVKVKLPASCKSELLFTLLEALR